MRVGLICTALTMLLATGCGRGGDGGSSDGTVPDTGGTIDDNPRDVSGSFFVGDTAHPAAGYELLLVDWSDNSIRSFVIRQDGSVTLELSEFVEARTYSFHLISGDRKIGDLDLSGANAGLQSAFAYRGGYGFSLGNVVIPLNAHGLIAVPAAGLPATVGGGFSLAASSQALKLEDVPVPSLLSQLSAQPTMVVSRSDDLFYGFLNIVEPSAAAAIRSKYAAVSLAAEAAEGKTVTRVFSSRISDWQSGARILPSVYADITAGTSWSATAFHLAQAGMSFSAEVLPGRDIINRLIFIKVEGEEPPQIEVPRVVTSGYIRPPFVSAIDLAGGTPQNVDYADSTVANGLINPFCHSSGDVVANFSLPLGLDGVAVDGTTLDQIAIMPEYFTKQSGVTIPISVSAAIPAPWNADIADAAVGDYLRAWTVATKTLTFSLTPANLSATQHTITLPTELFPSYLGGKAVTRVKVRYLFKSKSHPGKSGSVFWIRKDC